MRTAYAVSSGCYSDYRVHCFFESKEDAEAHVRERGDDAGVEEMHFYPTGDIPEKVTWAEARGDVGGMEVEVVDRSAWPDDYDADKATSRPVVSYNPEYRWGGNVVRAHCADHDAAVKAVKDRLAALKASLIEIPFELGDNMWQHIYPGALVATDAFDGEFVVRGWDRDRRVLYTEPKDAS